MATISARKIKQEGLSLIFKTNPAVGLLTLTALVDTVVGVFTKTFRYSTNGVTFSAWIPLTVPNITSITLEAGDVFVAELNYYTTDPNATATGISLTSTNAAIVDETVYFKDSLFKRYFNSQDPEILNWYINVLEKIYEKGLLANYLDRLDDFESPEDFIAFWGSVTKFFAFYVKFARVFARFYENDQLIREFLQQRGLQTSPEDSLLQLQYMLETFFRQMGDRGTMQIAKTSDDVNTPSGELLRAIHYINGLDDFIFLPYREHLFGWSLGNSSPLHRGLRLNDNINKIPWSLNRNEMTGANGYTTSGSVVADATIGKSVLAIAAGDSLKILGNDRMTIDSEMDYQVSFRIKMPKTMSMNLSVQGSTRTGSPVSFRSRVDGVNSSVVFNNARLCREDKYLSVKFYIYNVDRGIFSQDTTSIRQGNNLICKESIVRLGLTLELNGVGVANICDFKLQPMNTLYSRGFMQANNFVSIWLRNRNASFTTAELEDYVKHYLIPYNCHLKVTNIGDKLYNEPEYAIDQFHWIGGGEYCRKVVWVGADPSCELVEYIWVPDEETSFCEQI